MRQLRSARQTGRIACFFMPENLIGKKVRAGKRDEFLRAASYWRLKAPDIFGRPRVKR